MQDNKAIIVCSVYQSQTSESIVRLIRDLCPGQEILFQQLEKTTQFDGRKVVFCHSSYSGRLALTDVNDSIYDKAVKDASRIVGKENVAFVVTDVEAADVHLRRKMITQTQHTLVSKTSLLLLVGKVNDIDDEVLGQLKEFLTMIRLPPQDFYNRYPPQVNKPPYELLKFLLQFAIMVIIIACYFSLNSRLDLIESRISVMRKESLDISKLETEMKKMQGLLKNNTKDLWTLHNQVKYLQTELQNNSSEQRNDFVVRMIDIDKKHGVLHQSMNKALELCVNKTTLETLLQNNMNNLSAQFQKLETKIEEKTLELSNDKIILEIKAEFQNELKTKIEDLQSSLTENMKYLKKELLELVTDRLLSAINDYYKALNRVKD